jgi:hypothetical protein
MIQLRCKDDYVVVVMAEVVDLVTMTTKVQAQAQDLVIPERSSNWTYSIFKDFETRIE